MKQLGLFFLNLYLYTLFIAASLVVIPVLTVFVALLAPFSSRRRTMKRFRRGISWYGKVITAMPYPFIRLRYEDRSGGGVGEPYIFVCNHRSASDAFLMCVLPHEAVQIVNVWPFRIPVIGQYAKFSGYLNVNRMPREEFFRRAQELLEQGVSIIFFPEGTRSATGVMGPFHGTAFRLAMESKAAVVPLCIVGNDSIPPKGSPVLRPGVIRVRRLPAIRWEEYRDLTAFAFKNRVWKTIDQELKTMEPRS